MKKIILTLLACIALFSGAYATNYDCDNQIMPHTTASSNTAKREFQTFLNEFCKQYYHSCFSGRTYVENSLEVLDISYPTASSVRLDGTHSYRGRFGVLYSGHQFYAIIKKKGETLEVTFYKRSAPDLFHDDYYWESCTKTITE